MASLVDRKKRLQIKSLHAVGVQQSGVFHNQKSTGKMASKTLHAVGVQQSGVSHKRHAVEVFDFRGVLILQKRGMRRMPWGWRCQLIDLSCPQEWPLVWTGKLTPDARGKTQLEHS